MNYKIYSEITFSGNAPFTTFKGFGRPFLPKSKIGVDLFIPDTKFKMLVKLKVPDGYKFPDFEVRKNYNTEK